MVPFHINTVINHILGEWEQEEKTSNNAFWLIWFKWFTPYFGDDVEWEALTRHNLYPILIQEQKQNNGFAVNEDAHLNKIAEEWTEILAGQNNIEKADAIL